MAEEIIWSAFVVFLISWVLFHMGTLQAQGGGILLGMVSMFAMALGAGLLNLHGVAEPGYSQSHAFKPFVLVALIIGTEMLFRTWRPFERREARKQVRLRFQSASRMQVRAVVSKMMGEARVVQFSLINGQLMFHQGNQTSIWKNGFWVRTPSPVPYEYQQEAELLKAELPDADMVLEKASIREICVNLFFGWQVSGFEREAGFMSINFSRLGESKTKRYPCTAYSPQIDSDSFAL